MHMLLAQKPGVICDKDPNVLFSADVDYPPWVMNLPGFVSERDRNWFLQRIFGAGNFQKFGFHIGQEKECPSHLYAWSLHPFAKVLILVSHLTLPHSQRYFEKSFPPKKRVVLWLYPFVKGKHIILENGIASFISMEALQTYNAQLRMWAGRRAHDGQNQIGTASSSTFHRIRRQLHTHSWT